MAANRTKTIEYSFATVTGTTVCTNDIGTTPAVTFAQITVDIPEDTSRTFKSVYIKHGYRDEMVTTAINQLNQTRASISIDGGAAINYDFTDVIAQTGENISGLIIRDITAQFVSEYTGTSHTVDLEMKIVNGHATNIEVNNFWAKLVITYEYDDTAHTTRIKTVRIPIQSKTTILANGATTEIGTNQVPLLDTFLPESSKVYKDIFFEIWSNEGASSTTDTTLDLELDSEGATSFGLIEKALASATTDCFIWKRLDMTTSSAHAFKAGVTGANQYDTLGAVLTVTYTYDHSSSSTIINSLMIPIVDEYGFVESTTAADNGVYQRNFNIEEPETITLKQSGLIVTCNYAAATNLHLRTNSQSDIPYTLTGAGQMCGPGYLIHRVDLDNGLTLARGRNNITIYAYCTTAAGAVSNLNACLLLNYTSGKHADGDGAHSHTIYHLICETQPNNNMITLTPTPPSILSSNYWLMSLGIELNCMGTGTAAGFGLEVSNEPGEFEGVGWTTLYSSILVSDAETCPLISYCRGVDEFRRNPDDCREYHGGKYLDVETQRSYRVYSTNVSTWPAIIMLLTYNTITFTIAGTISGYTGDGSGITVKLMRELDNTVYQTTTTAAGGTFSFTWYDDVEDMYCTARQDATHVGRSDNGTAV